MVETVTRRPSIKYQHAGQRIECPPLDYPKLLSGGIPSHVVDQRRSIGPLVEPSIGVEASGGPITELIGAAFDPRSVHKVRLRVRVFLLKDGPEKLGLAIRC